MLKESLQTSNCLGVLAFVGFIRTFRFAELLTEAVTNLFMFTSLSQLVLHIIILVGHYYCSHSCKIISSPYFFSVVVVDVTADA